MNRLQFWWLKRKYGKNNPALLFVSVGIMLKHSALRHFPYRTVRLHCEYCDEEVKPPGGIPSR